MFDYPVSKSLLRGYLFCLFYEMFLTKRHEVKRNLFSLFVKETKLKRTKFTSTTLINNNKIDC